MCDYDGVLAERLEPFETIDNAFPNECGPNWQTPIPLHELCLGLPRARMETILSNVVSRLPASELRAQ
jgi:hypothetical protein